MMNEIEIIEYCVALVPQFRAGPYYHFSER
jgi:hypothetical protein